MKNLAFVFPGQGSQFIGMGKELVERSRVASEVFDIASDTLGMDMRTLCFNGPTDRINSTENTQPALLLCSVASYLDFSDKTGLVPVVMAGHSLGELSALVAADVMTLEDGLKLALGRGQAMADCVSHEAIGMSAVTKLVRSEVEEVCERIDGFGSKLVIANFNSSHQIVLSGDKELLQIAEVALKKRGASVIPLRVSSAFHSPYMSAAEEKFRELVSTVEFQTPTIPVVANVDACLHNGGSDTRDRLIQQLTSPVLWQDSVEGVQHGTLLADSLGSEKIDYFIEVGPGQVLTKLVGNILQSTRSFSLDDENQRQAVMSLLDTDIRTLQEQPPVLGKCLAVAVSTRNTNWDNDSYKTNVLIPYQELKTLHETTAETGARADQSTVDKAFDLLRKILNGKGVSELEQQRRFRELSHYS